MSVPEKFGEMVVENVQPRWVEVQKRKSTDRQTSLQELWWEKQLEGIGGLKQQQQRTMSAENKGSEGHTNMPECKRGREEWKQE